MSEETRYSLEEAHLAFAKKTNGRVWELLGKGERSKDEDEEMLHAAHASLFHWLHAGKEVNRQRGEWMIARVHTTLGNGEEAIRHASRCLELTQAFPDQMADFDRAYAYEGAARAAASAGRMDQAAEYLQNAEDAGNAIAGDEDRKFFFEDFNGGDWFGAK